MAAISAGVTSTRSPAGAGKRKVAALQPLGPDGQAVAVPVEDLEPVAAPVPEDEEVSGEGVLGEDRGGPGREAVERWRFMMTSD